MTVPTIVLECVADGVGGPSAEGNRDCFTVPYEHRFLPGVGHNAPQEDPKAFARAVISLL